MTVLSGKKPNEDIINHSKKVCLSNAARKVAKQRKKGKLAF